MKKIYILDTNVLLSDPNALFSFEENDVVLPLIVVEELDRHKDRMDNVGANARETARKLSSLTKTNKEITKGISLGTNLGKLFIMSVDDISIKSTVPKELNEKYGDNIILAFCKSYIAANPKKHICLVSRDVLLRIKSEVVGVPSEDYRNSKVQNSSSKLDGYGGVEHLISGQVDLEKFYSNEPYFLTEKFIEENNIFPNEFLVMKDDFGRSAIARFISKNKPLRKINEAMSAWSVKAKNKEQAFALDLLFDDNIKLVSLVGKAGSGKTLLSTASALDQIITKNKYKKLIITRSAISVGKEIGFLPGTLEEKMSPFLQGFKDNLEFLFDEDTDLAKDKGAVAKKKQSSNTVKSYILQEYMEKGIIEMEAMSFVRGRSINNAFIIIDETQNMTKHEMKTILTRVGFGSKIVILGDTSQLDNMYLDATSNGLSIAVESFKPYEIAGHVTLIKGERSELSTIAAEALE